MSSLTIIKAKKAFSWEDFKELFKKKELLYFFVWKDLKVRYKQTAIGVSWAILQPFITMVVFSLFFGRLANLPSDGVPYPIFVYSGLLLWQFFASSLTDASNSLVGNQHIITKIYFPRLILPFSAVLSKLVDFFLAALILVGLMFYYGYVPSLWALLILPLVLIIALIAATGGGLFLGALNVKYRDVRFALPFFIQMLLFITPVIYPISLAGKYAWLLYLNPMTGVIRNAQAVILNNAGIDWNLLLLSACISLAVFFLGFIYFKKTEKYFADII